MKTITFKYNGETLNELYSTFGKGGSGFYSDWWKKETFANERAEIGTYEIIVEKYLSRKTYAEQKTELPDTHVILHPAIIVSALLHHYKDMGVRLCSDFYSRTSVLDSDGHRVSVGDFDAEGLNVTYWDDDLCHGGIRVSAARKIETGNLESTEPSESLELRVKKIEDWIEREAHFTNPFKK